MKTFKQYNNEEASTIMGGVSPLNSTGTGIDMNTNGRHKYKVYSDRRFRYDLGKMFRRANDK